MKHLCTDIYVQRNRLDPPTRNEGDIPLDMFSSRTFSQRKYNYGRTTIQRNINII